jgi:hypothetical protein
MPKAVKSLVFITITVLLSLSINAQLKLPSLSATATDIKKVIENYPGTEKGDGKRLITSYPVLTFINIKPIPVNRRYQPIRIFS